MTLPNDRHRAEDRAEHAEDLPLRIGLARMRVIGRDVADLVAESEGELRLIVHQPQQLAGDVNIAAGHRQAHFRPRELSVVK